MSGQLAISANGLGKRYRLGYSNRAKQNSLRDALQAGALSLLRRGKAPSRAVQQSGQTLPIAADSFWALQDASFDIAFGKNVGIIGLNGAGKSTLLKILSRIVVPTDGTAQIRGRLGALLEVGTGFHQELTGRENVFLYGAILGMSRAEVARKFDAIVDFSEIERFIDTPVKRYSSGMYVRLAFAVAAHLDPDILLLDEVLAVGDFTFQRKCMDFAHRLERGGSTILFVSHNMFSIKSMCSRVIYLKQGKVVFDGATDEGLKRYEADSRLSATSWFRPDGEERPITITQVEICGEDGRPKTMFDFGDRMRIRASYRASRPIIDPNFLFSLTRSDDVLCSNFCTATDGFPIAVTEGEGQLELLTPPLSLVSETYTLSVVVRERGFHKILCAQIGGTFHTRHPILDPVAFGVFHESGQWHVPYMEKNRHP